jgi:hypothetical protein
MPKFAIALIASLVVVPAFALAGKKATAGDQSLQITGSLAPAKAGGKSATLKFSVDYESLNDNAQVKENTKTVILKMPAGAALHPAARAQCTASELAKNGESACPAGSKVGQGTGTADARPALPDAVTAVITLFNGLDDTNPDGTPRDPAVPALIVYAKTSIANVNVVLPFDIKGSNLELDYAPPAAGSNQLFHLQKVDVTVPKGAGKPYVTTPATCKKTWKSSMTITNFDGPTVTATHAQKCKK